MSTSSTPTIAVGDIFPIQTLTSIHDQPIAFRGKEKGLIHLQLRRFAGCPICNTHLRSISKGFDRLTAAGVTEVIVFHSDKDVIQEIHETVEWTKGFTFVADPQRDIYKKLGADFSGWRYLLRLRPSTLAAGIGGIGGLFRSRWGAEAGVTQRPMDVLVDGKDGRVVDLKYGIDPNDQWSLAEVLERVEAFNKKNSK
ncbi:hypothetical protein HDU97_004963 [Phlyctochytrium planicorne]|nr:hypothetical protein HDU97_004963 [Phlyctochytrium planicorne]